jgi:hypothetical protein
METKAPRKKRGDTHYVNNKEFTAAIVACKGTGELSPFAVQCFIALANRAVNNLYFRDPRDREDCIQSALYDCCKYWKGFDETRENLNAFAYFTQMCKNGYAKEWKKIHHRPGLEKGEQISFISINLDGENAIYSI